MMTRRSTTSAWKVQVLNSSGTVLATLQQRLDHNTGYAQRTFSLSAYAGQVHYA